MAVVSAENGGKDASKVMAYKRVTSLDCEAPFIPVLPWDFIDLSSLSFIFFLNELDAGHHVGLIVTSFRTFCRSGR